MNGEDVTITATEFKAKCLNLLDQIATRKLSRLTITKRGKPVAIVTPSSVPGEARSIFGYMRGSVIIPPDLDLTAPVLDEPLNAEMGRLLSE